ncbi:restriction endonuclease type II-like protein [Phycomyces nitens]|nr:restriction endonuclease type II-like protein [Phycomyces nitens]
MAISERSLSFYIILYILYIDGLLSTEKGNHVYHQTKHFIQLMDTNCPPSKDSKESQGNKRQSKRNGGNQSWAPDYKLPPMPQSNPSPWRPQTANQRKSNGGSIIVNTSQQENPLLKHIRNVAWELDSTIKPDYVVGKTTGVLYLSLRYHRLHPEYIYDRMSKLANAYVLKVLLVFVDIDNYSEPLRELNCAVISHNFTLMLSWSLEEAGRYLETYKYFENKSSDLLRERVVDDYQIKMTDCLTNVTSVNKTDTITLLTNFESFKGITKASTEALSMCAGFGDQKVKRLQNALRQPFMNHK